MNQLKTKQALVIHYFLTEVNSSSKAIADKLGLSVHRVNTILDKYLKSRKINES